MKQLHQIQLLTNNQMTKQNMLLSQNLFFTLFEGFSDQTLNFMDRVYTVEVPAEEVIEEIDCTIQEW
jgi:hypothetical protein